MAALGVHDSGAHVAGFTPLKTQLSGGASSSIPLSARGGSRRRRYHDYNDGGIGGAHKGHGSGSGSGRQKRRPRRNREETDSDEDDDGTYDDDEDSNSADDAYRDGYRRKSSSGRGLSPRHGVGGGERGCRGSTSPKRRLAGDGGSCSSPRRSPARGGGDRSRRSRVEGSGDSSSDLAEETDDFPSKRRRQSQTGDPKKRGFSR